MRARSAASMAGWGCRAIVRAGPAVTAIISPINPGPNHHERRPTSRHPPTETKAGQAAQEAGPRASQPGGYASQRAGRAGRRSAQRIRRRALPAPTHVDAAMTKGPVSDDRPFGFWSGGASGTFNPKDRFTWERVTARVSWVLGGLQAVPIGIQSSERFRSLTRLSVNCTSQTYGLRSWAPKAFAASTQPMTVHGPSPLPVAQAQGDGSHEAARRHAPAQWAHRDG